MVRLGGYSLSFWTPGSRYGPPGHCKECPICLPTIRDSSETRPLLILPNAPPRVLSSFLGSLSLTACFCSLSDFQPVGSREQPLK